MKQMTGLALRMLHFNKRLCLRHSNQEPLMADGRHVYIIETQQYNITRFFFFTALRQTLAFFSLSQFPYFL